MQKWRYRYINERDSLWVKVIDAIHGNSNCFRFGVDNISGNEVWAHIVKSFNDLHIAGIMPHEVMVRVLGNGLMSSLWHDVLD